MKLVYSFSPGQAEGSKEQANLLGGKGANLAEMSKLGLPVPPGLTIPTEACVEFMEYGEANDVVAQAALINACVEKVIPVVDTWADGATSIPLVSVRSGARVSMPGMMDTILNVGLTVENIDEYREAMGDKPALDSFRRLIQMYANVVHGVPNDVFEYQIIAIKGFKYGMDECPVLDSDLSVTHLGWLITAYLAEYEEYVGESFPATLTEQLSASIRAVFLSWNSDRAKKYRKVHGYPDTWGTAVNIQQMVFGNLGDDSASGVIFTRNKDTGENTLYGDWLPNAQGEDVVAGIRDPLPISEFYDWNPCVADDLVDYAKKLEEHYNDMQDMEFTVESGKLWILQTRHGKRSAQAAFRIAYDMAEAGEITKSEAIERVTGKQYLVLTKPQIESGFNKKPDFVGKASAGSVVSGIAVFSSKEAEKCKQDCILVAKETTPEDFGGISAAVGILTQIGGKTSHAAVVAGGMDKTFVVGCTDMVFDAGQTVLIVGTKTQINPGTKVTLDGVTGRVWVGADVPVVKLKIDQYVRDIIKWASEGQNTNILVKITPEIGLESKKWRKELETQLPTEGSVYIDTANLSFGKSSRNPLSKLFNVLKSRPELSGVIGLTREPDPVTDYEFLGFLGVEPDVADTDEQVVLNSRMKVLLQGNWNKKFKKRWILRVPAFAATLQKDALSAAGWRQVWMVSTLAELMKVNGLIDVAPNFEEELKKQGIELEAFIGILKDAGRTVDPMPRVVSKDRMIFEVLGKG